MQQREFGLRERGPQHNGPTAQPESAAKAWPSGLKSSMSARHTCSELDFCCHHHKGQHSDPFPNVPRKERKDQQLHRLTQLPQDGAIECSAEHKEIRTEATEKGPNSSIQISCESLAVRVKKLNVSSSRVVRVGFLLSSSQRPAFRSFSKCPSQGMQGRPNYHRTAPLSVARNTRRSERRPRKTAQQLNPNQLRKPGRQG